MTNFVCIGGRLSSLNTIDLRLSLPFTPFIQQDRSTKRDMAENFDRRWHSFRNTFYILLWLTSSSDAIMTMIRKLRQFHTFIQALTNLKFMMPKTLTFRMCVYYDRQFVSLKQKNNSRQLCSNKIWQFGQTLSLDTLIISIIYLTYYRITR